MDLYLATWLKPIDYIYLYFFPPKLNTKIYTNQPTTRINIHSNYQPYNLLVLTSLRYGFENKHQVQTLLWLKFGVINSVAGNDIRYNSVNFGNLKMVGPKKQDFCNVVTRFQGIHLIFWNGRAFLNLQIKYRCFLTIKIRQIIRSKFF